MTMLITEGLLILYTKSALLSHLDNPYVSVAHCQRGNIYIALATNFSSNK